MLLLLTVEGVSRARTLRQPGKQQATKACRVFACASARECKRIRYTLANVNNRATVYLSLCGLRGIFMKTRTLSCEDAFPLVVASKVTKVK